MLILKQNKQLLFGFITLVSLTCLLSHNRRQLSLCCWASYLGQIWGDLWRLSSPTSAQSSSNTGCGASVSWALKLLKDRNSTASLGNLFQSLIILLMIFLFIMSGLLI